MTSSKKDKPVSLRLTERMKRLIEEEADKDSRSFQDQAVVLFAEALHNRKYNIKNYT